MEVGFGQASFIGIDLLKFQVSSCAALDQIDIGIYVMTTKSFQKKMRTEFAKNWDGSLNFEKVVDISRSSRVRFRFRSTSSA